MKKILLIGATGAIGQAVARNLGARHQLITASRSSGDHRVDLADDASVAALLETVGKVDAIVSATGNLHFGPLTEMTAEQFNVGLQDKLLGQVRLALRGQHYLNDGGSITLTIPKVRFVRTKLGGYVALLKKEAEALSGGAMQRRDTLSKGQRK